MKTTFALVLLVATLGWFAGLAQAQEILNQDNDAPDCIADWDPFCPAGTGSSGGGGGGTTFTCQYCQFTKEFTFRCAQVALGDTGRTECTANADGTECTPEGLTCGRV